VNGGVSGIEEQYLVSLNEHFGEIIELFVNVKANGPCLGGGLGKFVECGDGRLSVTAVER
jgi:hypothetical protein